jgi:hypothetical protein
LVKSGDLSFSVDAVGDGVGGARNVKNGEGAAAVEKAVFLAAAA